MNIGIGMGLTGRKAAGGSVFSPASLFAASEPGGWYDPSDLTTLFQDTAGTTPVTTPGQTVALALDKSKGLVLGSELVTNGTFNTDITGWSPRAAGTTLSWVSGQLRINTGAGSFSSASQVLSLTVGRTYLVTATIYTENAATPTKISIVNNAAFAFIANSAIVTSTSPTNVRLIFTATETNNRVDFYRDTSSNTHAVFADNISVKELPGFHATQATLASRPTYGIVPLGGRRNLLTRTEEFNDAAWTAKDATVAANGSTAPDGTATADAIVENTVNTTHFVAQNASFVTGQTYTATVYLKSRERSIAYLGIDSGALGTENGYAFFNVGTGATGSTSSAGGWTVSSPLITPVGTSGWYRCSVTVTVDSTVTGRIVCGPTTANGTFAYAGTTGSGILIWGAQLETGSSATAYQRVGSAFDVTEAGVASLSYLSFDGVDDFLVPPTITPGTDKAQVFAGVRKLSDAATGILIEASTNSGTNPGVFNITAPNGTGYGWRSAGTATSDVAVSSGYSAPISNVLTGIGDIAGDVSRLRINGTQVGQTLTDQGTGNFLAYPLYIGRRAGTSLPFNGQIYSLLVRFGTNLDAGTITSTETWVNGKTGAYA